MGIHLETIGSLIKEEQVKTIERGILPNTLVLENQGFFPAYYGSNPPTKTSPDSIFLVMTEKQSTEKLLRITNNIKKQTGLVFEGSPATLCIYNTDYNAIRLRYLLDLDHIAEIQEHYRDSGINFAKSKQIDDTAVIKVKKIFKIESVTDKILKDVETGMYYLKINEQLTWSLFKKVTAQVRNNVRISAFDAALGVIYGSDVIDVARIYSTKLSMAELEQLHDKYEEIILQSLK